MYRDIIDVWYKQYDFFSKKSVSFTEGSWSRDRKFWLMWGKRDKFGIRLARGDYGVSYSLWRWSREFKRAIRSGQTLSQEDVDGVIKDKRKEPIVEALQVSVTNCGVKWNRITRYRNGSPSFGALCFKGSFKRKSNSIHLCHNSHHDLIHDF